MVTLLEKLGSKALQASLKPKKTSIAPDLSAQYALSKVIEAKLGGSRKAKSKYEEHLHFRTLYEKGDERTEAETNEYFRGKADLALIVTDKGVIRTVTHEQLEDYWNVIPETRRLSTHVYKPYWLGDGFEIDLKAVKFTGETAVERIEAAVNESLINNIVQSVQNWKENPVGIKVFRKGTKKEHEIVKGTWYERCVADWSGVGLEYSTYRYDLLVSLVENGTIPDSIPEDVLPSYVRKEILKRLGLEEEPSELLSSSQTLDQIFTKAKTPINKSLATFANQLTSEELEVIKENGLTPETIYNQVREE